MLNTLVSIVAWQFLIFGVWGFFQDPILGVLDVDLEHNLVHIISGVVGLAMVYADRAALYAKIMGGIYAVLFVFGVIMGEGQLFGIVAINMADNIYHLIISGVLFYAAFAVEAPRMRRA